MVEEIEKKPILNKATIVILADSNNPRLINPDFLSNHDIVPKDWVAEDVIVTPPVARVAYKNKFTILVEESKLTFEASDTESIEWHKVMPKMVNKFLEILPRVSYRSVGLNFEIYVPTKNEEIGYVSGNFIREGNWKKIWKGLSTAKLQLIYGNQEPRLNLYIEEAELREKYMYKCSANFHHDFNPGQITERAKYIKQQSEFYSELLTIVNELPFE